MLVSLPAAGILEIAIQAEPQAAAFYQRLAATAVAFRKLRRDTTPLLLVVRTDVFTGSPGWLPFMRSFLLGLRCSPQRKPARVLQESLTYYSRGRWKSSRECANIGMSDDKLRCMKGR